MSQTPTDPLQALAESHREIVAELTSLRKEVTTTTASLLTAVKQDVADLGSKQHEDAEQIRKQIREQAESKFWKILYLLLPVLLGAFVWWLQIDTNQKIDISSKRAATRLALTEAFYKRKLAVYEDADRQMATLVGCLEDLRLNPNDSAKVKLAYDNVRTLSDMSKVNGLFVRKDIAQGLADVSFAAAGMPLLNGKPMSNLHTLTDQVASVEQLMKQELDGQFGTLE